MDKIFKILTVTIYILFPCVIIANDLPKEFHNLESFPKLSISNNQSGWPVYEVESVKYHLHRLFIKPNSPSVTYLLKEKSKTEFTDGIEGSRSHLILELWELGAKNIEEKIWSISQKAHKWKFHGSEKIVLIEYGCCDSPNKYTYYDIKTGLIIRNFEGKDLKSTIN